MPIQLSVKRDQAGTVLQHAPPTQGLASLIILAWYDRLNIRGSRGLSSSRTVSSRQPNARLSCLRDRVSPIRVRVPRSRMGNCLEPGFLDG